MGNLSYLSDLPTGRLKGKLRGVERSIERLQTEKDKIESILKYRENIKNQRKRNDKNPKYIKY